MLTVCVAHVVHSLAAGGAERRLLAILERLDPQRFETLLVCLDGPGPLDGAARALGLEPVVLERRSAGDLRALVRLVQLLRRERVAIVHGWLPLPSVFARVAGTLARVPVRIVSAGVTIVMTEPRVREYAVLDRILAPLTGAYVANSEAVAASMRSHGVPDAKLLVIRNGVATPEPLSGDERRGLRAELGAGNDTQLVGMIARLESSQKDFGTFLRAVAALVGAGRPVHAAVIGDGPHRHELEQQAAQLGIADRVTFTGYRPDASRLVGALDVSAMLSRFEGLSHVVLESMAAGVPVVATSIAPNREAVADGVHGLLVPVEDVAATAAALGRLLDDRGYAKALGAAARERASTSFSLEAQAASTAQLYERLLAQKRR